MKLYTYYRSSASYRVRIALNLKQLDCEYVYLDLKNGAQKKDDYSKINPQQFVPALEITGSVLKQSLSIIRYLDSLQPTPPLYGTDKLETAKIEAAAQVIAIDIHPIDNLRVLKYLKGQLDQQQAAIDDWYRHWITEGFNTLEQLVEPHDANTAYCFGQRLSLADICLAPQMYNARRFATDLSAYPKLVAIDSHLMSLDAFSQAAPENQADCDL